MEHHGILAPNGDVTSKYSNLSVFKSINKSRFMFLNGRKWTGKESPQKHSHQTQVLICTSRILKYTTSAKSQLYQTEAI